MSEARAQIAVIADKLLQKTMAAQKPGTVIVKKPPKKKDIKKGEEEPEAKIEVPKEMTENERLSNVLKTVESRINTKSKRDTIPKDMEKTLRNNSTNKTIVFKMDERKKMKVLFYSSLKQSTENRLQTVIEKNKKENSKSAKKTKEKK